MPTPGAPPSRRKRTTFTILGVAVAILAGVIAIGVPAGDNGGKGDAAAAGPVASSPTSTDGDEPTRAATTAPADDSPEPTTPSPAESADDDGNVDPRFATCEKANDAGYGPYHRDDDPEYSWYRDRDEDGIVCER